MLNLLNLRIDARVFVSNPQGGVWRHNGTGQRPNCLYAF